MCAWTTTDRIGWNKQITLSERWQILWLANESRKTNKGIRFINLNLIYKRDLSDYVNRNQKRASQKQTTSDLEGEQRMNGEWHPIYSKRIKSERGLANQTRIWRNICDKASTEPSGIGWKKAEIEQSYNWQVSRTTSDLWRDEISIVWPDIRFPKPMQESNQATTSDFSVHINKWLAIYKWFQQAYLKSNKSHIGFWQQTSDSKTRFSNHRQQFTIDTNGWSDAKHIKQISTTGCLTQTDCEENNKSIRLWTNATMKANRQR